MLHYIPQSVAVLSEPNDINAVSEAARLLAADKLVAFPTDTFFALGANALSEKAVGRVVSAKKRPDGKPLPVLIGGLKQLESIARPDGPAAQVLEKLAEAFWPGALTVVLRKTAPLAPALTGGGDTIGVRVPDHPLAAALLAQVPFPVVATSANLAGEPPVKNSADLSRGLLDSIDYVVKGNCGEASLPSTVITLASDPPQVVRQGAVAAAELKRFVPNL